MSYPTPLTFNIYNMSSKPAGKGEAVCLDRCVAKYLDVHERIGKKLSTMSQGEEDLTKINLQENK